MPASFLPESQENPAEKYAGFLPPPEWKNDAAVDDFSRAERCGNNMPIAPASQSTDGYFP